jgi:hypothetical protein
MTGGASTPLPLFFDHHLDERENSLVSIRHSFSGDNKDYPQVFGGMVSSKPKGKLSGTGPWAFDVSRKPMAQYPPSMNKTGGENGPRGMTASRMPPTPVYSFEQREDMYGRGGPHMGGDRRDGPPPPEFYYSMPPQMTSGNSGDRVRNLRG